MANMWATLKIVWRSIWFLRGASTAMFLALAVSTIISSAIPPLSVVVYAKLFDVLGRLTSGAPLDIHLIYVYGGIYVVLYLLSDILSTVSQVTGGLFSDKVLGFVGLTLMRIMMQYPDISIFSDPRFYDRVNNLLTFGGVRPTQIVQNAIAILRNLVLLVTTIAILVPLSPWWVLVLLAGLVPFLIMQIKLSKTNWDEVSVQSPERRHMWYYSTVMLDKHYASEVRLLDLGKILVGRYEAAWSAIFRKLQSLRMRYVLTAAGASLVAAGSLIWIYSSLLRGVVAAQFSIGDVALFFGAVTLAKSSISGLANVADQIYSSVRYMQDLFDFADQAPQGREGAESAPQRNDSPDGPEYAMEFRHVSFKYPGSTQFALRDVSFRIPRGQSVALVGPNGAGKTTVVSLLTRLFEVEAGEVLIDGVDVKSYKPEELRRKLAVVMQDFARYSLPASDNIGFGDVTRIDDLAGQILAAEEAGIAARIQAMPKGFANYLGTFFRGGEDLSGGEWQRVALARSIFRGADIAILDEPSSVLDPQAEADMIDRMRQISRQTTLLISRRFSTVRGADHILVLKDGAICEQGTHEALMTRDGEYAHMFNLQAERYLA